MVFYNRNRPTKLTVDVSPVGLGAVLCQTQENGQDRCVAYASRSLITPVATRRVGCGVHGFIYILLEHRPLEIFTGQSLKPHFGLNVGDSDFNNTSLTSSINQVVATQLMCCLDSLHLPITSQVP